MISIEVFCVIVCLFAIAVIGMVFVIYDFGRKVKEVERYAIDISTMTTSAHDRCREVLDHCAEVLSIDRDISDRNMDVLKMAMNSFDSMSNKNINIEDDIAMVKKAVMAIDSFIEGSSEENSNNHTLLIEIKHMISDLEEDISDFGHSTVTGFTEDDENKNYCKLGDSKNKVEYDFTDERGDSDEDN